MNKPCVKCGGMERDKRGYCAACERKRKREWKANNPEKCREYRRKWKASNREKTREYWRKWEANNPEKRREYERKRYANNREKAIENARKWGANNREKQREYYRKWATNNPEKCREYRREWATSNPEKCRAHNHTRRARKAGNGGSFTAQEWKDLCDLYNNHCCYPGCKNTDLHADHVIPLVKGGTSDISNIQPLCAYHNLSKGTGTNDYRYKPGLKRWKQNSLFDF
jgi:hypothetical protein